ncbi:MAG: NADH-quinone oxidoreductase subunit L [Gemmatimonadetes bacterium]|nr:NADH-quinone oxidoreductase subunit L [Gemmatimonadota bacterium]
MRPFGLLLLQAPGLEDSQAAWEPVLPGLIILLPLLGFAINGALALAAARKSADAVRAGREFDFFGNGRAVTHTLPTWVGPGVLLLAFLLTVVNFVGMLGAELHEPVIRSYWSWITTGDLNIAAAIQLDQLSMVMMMIITGVGFLIHVFSVGYMQNDPGYPRYFAYLNLFIFFMLVLVMGASYPIMFIGWEGVGLCSYLLIGFWFSDEEKASAGKKAFIVNRIGDLGFLLAIFLLYLVFQRVDYAGIFGDAESVFVYGGPVITTVTLFFLLAAVGKSAQIPLHIWLPDAMAGPTPVSALIHAATMVTAGVYLVVRSSVLFALAPLSSAVVAGIGVLTALFAATVALRQQDIKKVLAYSTVSQLGFMFLGVGVGAYTAGIFHLMTHAFFKALLFLGAGAVIHSIQHALHHSNKDWDAQDMRNMGGLRAYMPITWIAMWLATLAIAGIWPFAGFFSKDEIIWMTGAMAGAENAPYAGLYTVYWVLALATAMLTAFYMTRLMVMTFHGRNRTGATGAEHLHEAPKTMWIPLAILATLSVFGGWINVTTDLRESVLGGFGALPMGEWLHHWLEPVTEAAHRVQEAHLGELAHAAPLGGGEVAWGLISTVAALAVVLVTARLLGRKEVPVAVEDAEPTGLSRILFNKWYVDEFYHRWVVDPVLTTSRVLWRIVDTRIIDGAVNLVGNAARAIGWLGSLLQTGQVNTYAFFFTLGVLVILAMIGF